ncbi:MAG: hypothetical protein IJ106_01305 [Parasporobacterium sp.]|nr:hypothetical protein [Parasporobacterium sp.]
MEFAQLIQNSRNLMNKFEYDEYAASFPQFEEQCRSLFDRLDLELPDQASREKAAARMVLELERSWKELPRKDRKKASFQDKQILALYFSPAAHRYGDPALAFAEEVRQNWNETFPRNTYLAGTYDAILKGFESSLLRLRLRKSKNNRKPRS